jgi:hypothetical protein
MSKAMVTVKRYFLLVIGVCIAISIIISCETLRHVEGPAEERVPEAVVTIVNWDQEYTKSSWGLVKGYWGLVKITYQVENTGHCDIDFYAVNFKVTCEDGEVYTWSDKGRDIPEGSKKLDTVYAAVGLRKATDVNIQDYRLKASSKSLKH